MKLQFVELYVIRRMMSTIDADAFNTNDIYAFRCRLLLLLLFVGVVDIQFGRIIFLVHVRYVCVYVLVSNFVEWETTIRTHIECIKGF